MPHTFRTIIIVIILIATSAVILGASPSSADSSGPNAYRSLQLTESRIRTTTPAVQTASDVEPLTEVEQVLVDWAIGRFTQAGLELPELTFRFDPSRELCRNHEGLYHQTPDGEKVVSICTRDSDSFAGQLERRRTLLHELGHAWDVANLSEEDHNRLAQILGADAWVEREDVWVDRGAERFAESFVFALLDQPARQLKVNLECSDLLAAFDDATGAAPLGPGLPTCAV